METIRGEMNIQLPVRIGREDDYFVAFCSALDVGSQGRTEKEARDNIVEALALFLVSCMERGTLDEVLRACGFRPTLFAAAEPLSSVTLPDREEYVNVPIHLLANSRDPKRCHE